MVVILLPSLKCFKIGDKVKILFYKGSGDTDVIFREVIETVKKR